MLQVYDPASGQPIATVRTDDAASIERKLVRAAAAQPAWARLGLQARAEAIARFAALLEAEQERLAILLAREVGKPIAQARAEIAGVQGRIGFFLAHTEETIAEQLVYRGGGLEERIRYEPLGVIAHISAWNYPWFVATNVVVPALLCGNAVLYKPSEHATLTGLELARLLHRSGVPAEVCIPVVGAGEVGALLLRPPVRGVFFTGSHATGVKVAAAAAPHLMRVQLELGGKDPLYVTDDVDLEWAARAAAEGAMYNAGQSCCAVERIYAHAAIYERFVERLAAAVAGLRVGDPLEETTEVGPLCRQAQLQLLQAQVEEALARGGRLACGGRRLERPGWYFAPTVIADAHHGMELMTEESFGPVIGVQPVADDEEALARMRDTRYGLTASVFCAERARAERLLAQLETGSAYWNCCDRVSPRLPWSGRRHSGVGVTLSRHGILAFVEPRGWHLREPSWRVHGCAGAQAASDAGSGQERRNEGPCSPASG
ncbi:MAG: aldehyde dehydrogenase [Planctomycetota bacterium]|nr:MAG: aldehyde dehydrogenase [Planctomycetota bacterium]